MLWKSKKDIILVTLRVEIERGGDLEFRGHLFANVLRIVNQYGYETINTEIVHKSRILMKKIQNINMDRIKGMFK